MKIIYNYFNLTRITHRCFDFLSPVVLSTLTVLILYYVVGINTDMSERVLETVNANIGIITTAFSILAGFNISSLTFFASSDSKAANTLRTDYMPNNPKITKMEQLLAYFSWTILVQLSLLMIAILWLFFVRITGWLWGFWIYVYLFFVLYFTLYAIMLTLRNLKILYMFLIVNSRE